MNLSGTEAIVSAGWSKFVLSPLRVLHALEVVSLDVAAGVAGSALLVASLSHSGPVPVAVFVAMVSAVLAVYNLDHFLDGSQIDTEASPRRRRYREHRKLIVSTAFAAAVCGAASMAFLPRAALVGGAVLVAYQAIYFLGLKKGLRGTAKRLAAAGGWAAGIALPAWSVFGQRGEILLAACILAALGWINLQSYSLVESRPEAEEDTAPGVAMRAAAVTVAAMLLAFAFATHPEQSRSWCALVAVGAVQVFLRRLPLDLVHPVGEWSLALLGLLALS